jgi:hypothetical protein
VISRPPGIVIMSLVSLGRNAAYLRVAVVGVAACIAAKLLVGVLSTKISVVAGSFVACSSCHLCAG